ncbi:chromate transporter [Ferviditalea candida]|uniref:Chromate transporter n=1 Tax=Ferviditalea candida TaxID=3108399 RepID=A0ABU5ZG76_9BACL|nr:chromate transporter [Paenibacillaceae bacterium T2]
MLLQLFWSFFKIGFISFGGGYAMIPVIEHEVKTHHWMNSTDFANAIALAGMAPGPIAANSAVYVGYAVDGLTGAIVATVGMVLPSLLLVILAAAFFIKIHRHRLVKAVFYGLRPVVFGLILFAAINLAWGYFRSSGWSSHSWIAVGILVVGYVALARYKVHPLVVILVSGLAGAAFFS